jgi:hypothetical protein
LVWQFTVIADAAKRLFKFHFLAGGSGVVGRHTQIPDHFGFEYAFIFWVVALAANHNMKVTKSLAIAPNQTVIEST